MTILFCENPFDNKMVDPDFDQELKAAVTSGCKTLLFSFESLTIQGDANLATKRISRIENKELTIYRGWMLKPSQYKLLYDILLEKNYQLINAPIQYQHTHYLPENYPVIKAYTPKTVWLKINDNHFDFSEFLRLVSVFGDSPVIIKDFVKSQKHYWDTACFVPVVSNHAHLKSVINRFLELQGSDLNEGIVIRKFVALSDLTNHSKSGMPLKLEYRLFFCQGRLISCYNYWEEGTYVTDEQIPFDKFELLSKEIQSNFFSMDIAKAITGEWLVIELGDGQVAGLPDNADKNEFFRRLTTIIK